MSYFKRETAGLDKVREVEVEIRDLLRREVSGLRADPQPESDPVTDNTDNIGSLVQQVTGTSVQELERLIVELSGMRETLSSEGKRVQREIVQYAALSQAAMQSSKTLADTMTRWSCGRG